MTDNILARVMALKTTPIAELKQLWRDLFNTEPPPYNRRFLENRLRETFGFEGTPIRLILRGKKDGESL